VAFPLLDTQVDTQTLNFCRAQLIILDPKKTLIARGPDEMQLATFRARFMHCAAREFVVVNATSSNLNLTPRYARASRGQRAYGTVPHTTPPNTTVIAAMSVAGMVAALVLDGAIDTAALKSTCNNF
jgi:hypothetical protein